MTIHPFKIVRGGQDEPKAAPSPPKKFARLDNRQMRIDRLMAEFFADRDRYIDKMRVKQKKETIGGMEKLQTCFREGYK